LSATLDVKVEPPKTDNSAEVAAITTELEQIERKHSEIMDLFTASQIDFPTYQQMVKRGNERRGKLESRLNQLQSAEKKEICYTKSEIVANFRDNWQMLDNEERQEFVHTFIKKMVVRVEMPNNERFGMVIIDEILFNEF
jgi:ribonuclease HI